MELPPTGQEPSVVYQTKQTRRVTNAVTVASLPVGKTETVVHLLHTASVP